MPTTTTSTRSAVAAPPARLYQFVETRVRVVDQWGLQCDNVTAHQLVDIIDTSGAQVGSHTWHNGYEQVTGTTLTLADGTVYKLYRNTIDYTGGSHWQRDGRAGRLYDADQVRRHARRPMIEGQPVTVDDLLAAELVAPAVPATPLQVRLR